MTASRDTPTQDLDRLAAFFGEGLAWTMPDDERWFGEDFTGSEVVARLRAAVEHLEYEQDYTPPTGAVSEGLRACVKAAGQACLDGEVDCPREGCVVGHRAGEILDAYDDAAAEVARLTEEQDAIWAERVEEGKVAARAGREAARLRVQLGVVQREVCERRSRDHGPRYGDDARFATKARSIAAALGWDCYDSPGGATPSEPGNAEYIAWSDGGMVGPAPGHGEPEQ